ncbi:MAG: hypothetical protein CSB23_01245 [Deltaproteobacteria bacterium]|nr:MAG: hypothetical protein CSB23_01245 [Deltaproteobacteria bacterium]
MEILPIEKKRKTEKVKKKKNDIGKKGAPARKRRLLWICLILLVAMPVFYVLSLYGAKTFLQRWLTENGADTARIEKLHVNPFNGRLGVEGVLVETGGKPMLKVADLSVDLSLLALLGKQLKLESVFCKGLFLDLQHYDDGRLRVGSYILPPSGEKSGTGTSDGQASSWAFLAESVGLNACDINWQAPYMNDMHFKVEDVQLKRFSTKAEDGSATLELTGLLDGESLAVHLTKLSVSPFLQMEGRLQVDHFKLEELTRLLKPYLPIFAGEFSLGGKFRVATGDGGETVFSAYYDGVIDANRLHIGSETFVNGAETLNWKGSASVEINAKNNIKISTNSLLSATAYALSVPSISFSTSEEKFLLDGPTSVTVGEEVLVQSSAQLQIEDIVVSMPDLMINEEKLVWQGNSTYATQHSAIAHHVETDGNMQLASAELTLGLAQGRLSAGASGFSHTGRFVYGQPADGSLIKLDGEFDGKDLYSEFAGSKATVEEVTIQLRPESQLLLAEELTFLGGGSLALKTLSADAGESQPQLHASSLVFDELLAGEERLVSLKGVVSDGLEMQLNVVPLVVDIPKMRFGGCLVKEYKNVTLEELQLHQSRVRSEQHEDLFSCQEIAVSKVSLDEDLSLAVDTLAVEDVSFLPEEEEGSVPVLTLEAAELFALQWGAQSGLRGKTLRLQGLHADLVRDKDGQMQVQKRLQAMLAASADEKNKENQEQPAEKATDKEQGDDTLPINLGRLEVKKGSSVRFEDRSLAVPFKTKMVVEEMVLQDLDSSAPEKKSQLLLRAMIDEESPFTLSGDISPFLQPIDLNVRAELKNYPLTTLSSYTVQSVGLALASGQLHLNSKMKLSENQIDMQNKVVLRKIETKAIAADLVEELNNKLPLPIDLALSLLRDSEGTISLDIPLSGHVGKLKVGISDVIITALSKGIVPAASGYLMYSLGPYGALAYAGVKVGEKLMQVRLPSVFFPPGEADPVESSSDYLQKVAKIMQERPGIDIQLTPVVTSWELMAPETLAEVEGSHVEVAEGAQAALVALGQQRAKAVQEFLVARYQIEQGRLLITETVIEKAKNDKPRVLLQL